MCAGSSMEWRTEAVYMHGCEQAVVAQGCRWGTTACTASTAFSLTLPASTAWSMQEPVLFRDCHDHCSAARTCGTVLHPATGDVLSASPLWALMDSLCIWGSPPLRYIYIDTPCM